VDGREAPGELRRPPGPTRREVIDGLTRELAAAAARAGIENPRLEAERLVSHALGLERAEVASTSSERLGPEEARRLATFVRRRLQGEPLQHIEGTVHFRELVLVADGRALIPRPETEQLVEKIVAWARRRAAGPADRGVRRVRRADGSDPPPLADALDIGTGSGAIALSLVHESVARRAVGIDVDAGALEQAEANRTAAGLDAERLELRLAAPSTWSAVRPGERFDLIVSNPPYVRDREMDLLPPHVRDREPRRALAGGRDGLDVAREIVSGASAHLREGGALFLEIGADQGPAVRELLMRSGAWREVRVERDLAGRERFVVAESILTAGGR
jgi:release factor glutamine methyltransferase